MLLRTFLVFLSFLFVAKICAQPPFMEERDRSKFGRRGPWRFKEKGQFKKETTEDPPEPKQTITPLESKSETVKDKKETLVEVVKAKPVIEYTRPVVYRYGKLPKSLPSWFAEYDVDGDGQIGLYEWREQEADLEDFLFFDVNKDGLITAEEFMRSLGKEKK